MSQEFGPEFTSWDLVDFCCDFCYSMRSGFQPKVKVARGFKRFRTGLSTRWGGGELTGSCNEHPIMCGIAEGNL